MDAQTHEVMGAALVERGIMTPDAVAADRAQLDAELSASNIFNPPAQAATQDAQPNAEQAAEVNPLDAMVWEPPKSIAEYNISNGAPPAGAEVSREFEMANRAALFHAGVPKSIGDQMAKLWHEANLKEPPTDAQLELSKRETLEILTKQWGDKTQTNLDYAKAVVAKMAQKQPAVWKMLEVSGAGNNPWLITTLANMARARGGKA